LLAKSLVSRSQTQHFPGRVWPYELGLATRDYMYMARAYHDSPSMWVATRVGLKPGTGNEEMRNEEMGK